MKSTATAAPVANPFMKSACRMIFRLLAIVCLTILSHRTDAAEPAPSTISASDLAARLSAWQQDGSSYVRLRMVVSEPAGKSAYQIQIKARRSKTGTDVVYQILWPKERKGEGVLLQKAAGRSATGAIFVPPNNLRPLEASQMDESFFGSALAYEDLVENFFAWEQQALVGTEEVDGVSCYILESKPGKGARSSYGKVRTWVDSRRLIPLRIEKYCLQVSWAGASKPPMWSPMTSDVRFQRTSPFAIPEKAPPLSSMDRVSSTISGSTMRSLRLRACGRRASRARVQNNSSQPFFPELRTQP